MAVTIQATNLEEVERKLGAFKDKAPKVLKLAVNDTARKARTRLAKEAQKTYAVKTGGFNSAMRIRLAKNSDPTATIYSTGKKIPLSKFAYRKGTLGPGRYYNPTTHAMQTGKGGKGATAKQFKSSGFKSDGGAKLKWFIAKMASTHNGIFQRNPGAKRGDKGEISQKMGPSMPDMIGSEKHVYGIVKPYIQKDLKEAVSRHISRAIRGEL